MTQNYILVRLNGVGWNAQIQRGNDKGELVLNVGYSHPVKMMIPEKLELKLRSETMLEVKIKGEYTDNTSISAQDKQLLGDFVGSLIRIRPWNIYTGHGIVRRDRTDNLVRRRGKRK
jgi:large subunit ribosomal protein L6